MKTISRLWYRSGYVLSALAILSAALFPILNLGSANAAQLTNRTITLSDSGVSGGTITSGVGSGTNVTYKVSFNTTLAAQSLVIDFCASSPIIGDTCTAPTSFSANGAALATETGGGNITSANWGITTSGATPNQVKISKTSGPDASVGTQTFDITGVTNPSTLGSYYARIYTYSDANYGTSGTAYSSPTAPGTFADYGGIALTTNNIITITARVQEQLTFCVSGTIQTSWTSHDCSDPNANTSPALTLGHPNANGVKILDATAVDTGTVYSQISTNATHGATIAMRNSNTGCGGLSADGGITCAIPAAGATPTAFANGNADFGVYAATPTDDPSGGVGSMTIASAYNDGTATHYGMDTTTANNNVKSTFGSTVATTPAPTYRLNDAYTFAAAASLTTPAGIYTANIDLIATGTF